METIRLNNGVEMPIIGFGTWGIHDKTIILEALKCGYRLIDTAHMYNNERIIGEALKEFGIDRKQIFITSKLNQVYASYDKAWQGILESLKNLQIDYLDMMLIHEPYPQASEMYRALEEAYHQGLIRAIGVSNYSYARFKNFLKQVTIIPAINQVESHVYFPQFQLKDQLLIQGVQMQAWSSFTDGKRSLFSESLLIEIGKKYQKSAAQVALRFLIQNNIAVIPKSRNIDRMKENYDLLDFELSQQDLNQIATLNEHKSLFSWTDY